MEVDVAMHDPGTRIIGLRQDDQSKSGVAREDGRTLKRITTLSVGAFPTATVSRRTGLIVFCVSDPMLWTT